MLRRTLTLHLLLSLLIPNLVVHDAERITVRQCNESQASCGQISDISYPFRLKGQPEECGESKYELICENNNLFVYFQSVKYSVLAINHNDFTLRIADSHLQKDNCSSLPLGSVIPFTLDLDKEETTNQSFYFNPYSNYKIVYVSCDKPVSNVSLFVDTKPCINGSKGRAVRKHSYVALPDTKLLDLSESCTIDLLAMSVNPIKCGGNCSYSKIHDLIANGFEVSWRVISCEKYCKGKGLCYLENGGDEIYKCSESCGIKCMTRRILSIVGAMLFTGLTVFSLYGIPFVLALRFVIGLPFLCWILIYKWRRRHFSGYDGVEEFLQSQNNLRPIKYSFSDVKRITRNFKDKLGEGGYGSVYKGTLRSGRDVAVKILGKSKSDGQDFINEVATIGRIHHVNVVRMIGFCAEGSKQALVYEFMPNGSLEKYIFRRDPEKSLLGYEKMIEISLGVARGIEYLHRGCDIRILHFDIKPHNILLDENFTPKVSDFGLAQLYPADGSFVSLTAARGTIGYIAPELFYKNIGAVSYKADVYSFGMLLLELTGKRRGLKAANLENSSEVYFHSWMHEQISEGKCMEIEDFSGNEAKLVRKMIIIGLWCIQTRPKDRPSMNGVIEMLKGEIESLEIPPKPSLYQEDPTFTDPTSSSVLSGNFTESSSLILNVV